MLMSTFCGEWHTGKLKTTLRHVYYGERRMLKKYFSVLCLCVLFLFLCIPTMVLAQSPGKIIFCKNIDDKMQPVDPAESFSTNVISWVSQTEKPYGKPTLVVTIYKKEGAWEQVLVRQQIQVRASWNASAMRNLTLPGEGTYLVNLDLPDGTAISSGVVTVTKVQTEPAPKLEILGDSVADIFNKYIPNN